MKLGTKNKLSEAFVDFNDKRHDDREFDPRILKKIYVSNNKMQYAQSMIYVATELRRAGNRSGAGYVRQLTSIKNVLKKNPDSFDDFVTVLMSVRDSMTPEIKRTFTNWEDVVGSLNWKEMDEAKKFSPDSFELTNPDHTEMDDGSIIVTYEVWLAGRWVGDIEDSREYDASIELSARIGKSRKNVQLYSFSNRSHGADKIFDAFLKTSKGKKWVADLGLSEGSMNENWEQFAKKKGYVKAKVVMTRVPVYARRDATTYKETTQTVYIQDPSARRTNVYWKNVIGSLNKNQRGEWASIDTDRANYEVDSLELMESFIEPGYYHCPYIPENINERVSAPELKDVEKFADQLFRKFDIDVEFTKHFADRVNDGRNNPAISAKELKDFFQKAFVRHGDNIASMTDGNEALLNDIQKELNLPFVYKWDGKNFEFDLVAKTIMRKRDFKSRTRKMRF